MINDKCQIINDNSLVKLIMLPTVLLELHFNVLYCIKRLMQCNVQWNSSSSLLSIFCNHYQICKNVRENLYFVTII